MSVSQKSNIGSESRGLLVTVELLRDLATFAVLQYLSKLHVMQEKDSQHVIA